jgi:PAS domain S-box-containing protein
MRRPAHPGPTACPAEDGRLSGGDWGFLPHGSAVAALMRRHDWTATPLGPPDRWPQPVRTLAGVMLGSSQPMFLAWGPERTLLYNDAYVSILAAKHPAAMGRPFLEVWHEIRDDLVPIVEAAYRGEPVQMDHIALWMERKGYREETHFAFSYTPVQDETGRIGGFFCVCQETTGQVFAERRLRESEARLRSVIDGMSEGFAFLDRDFVIREINDEGMRMENRPREALLNRSQWEAHPATRDSEIGRLYRHAMAERVPVSLEHRYVFLDGTPRWLEMRAYPVSEGLAVFYRDVTARKEAEERLRESEARAREEAGRVQLALDAGAILGTWDWDVPADRFTADDRFARAFGLDAEACRAGLPIAEVVATVHPDDRPALMERIGEAMVRGGSYRHEYRVRSADGLYHWIEASGRVDLGPDGRALRFSGVLLDIAARRAAEEERDRARRLLETFAEAVPGVVYAKDREGRMLIANRGTTALIGKPLEAYLGRTDLEFLDDEAQARAVMANDRRIMESGQTEQIEEAVSLPDGTPAVWFSTKAPLRDAEGRVVGLIGASIDITARKQAEATLREATRRLDAILNNTREAVFLMDDRQHCVYANAAAEKLTGYRFEQMRGRPLHDLVHHTHPDGRPYPIEDCPIDRAFPERAQTSGEEMFVAPDGSFYPVAFTASPVLDEAGRPTGTVIEARSIAEEKAREAALRESEERFRFALDAAGGIGTWDWDVAQDVIHTSEQFAAMYGLDPARARLGLPVADYVAGIHPDDQDRVRARIAEAVATGGDYREEYRIRRPDGEVRWVIARGRCLKDAEGRAVRFPGVTFDITDRKAAEARVRELNETLERRVAEAVSEREAAEDALRQSQKMEAVGQLTGGIAHDFNNMLAAVVGSLDLLSRRLPEGDARLRRYVDAAQEGAQRAAGLTQRLLAFSRQQPLRPETLDAGHLVAGMTDLLRHSLGSDIRLETLLHPDPSPVFADRNQLESVILNLAVNARDAMPEGGRLTIAIGRAEAGEAGDRTADGEFVRIAVSDSGSGMAPEIAARAFDPFFTTKPVGKGTGLGLSQVYGFVRQSGGQVRLETEPGRGTTVRLYLPRLAGEVSMAAAEREPSDLPRARPGEVVLVVEDEPAVRRFSLEALTELGYRPLEAGNAAEALRLLDAHPEIALLFTDMVMPDVNGRRLAEEAGRRRPGLPVLFTTGYARDAAPPDGALGPQAMLLPKPFTLAQLAFGLREVLDAGTAEGASPLRAAPSAP